MQSKLNLPVCNTIFGEAVTPWFQPLVKDYRGGHWYLGEDFAFCERIRLAGYKIFTDTTIRLQHYGNDPYCWEDAGRVHLHLGRRLSEPIRINFLARNLLA